MHMNPVNRGCRKVRIEYSKRLYTRAVSLPSSSGLRPRDVARCLRAMEAAIVDA